MPVTRTIDITRDDLREPAEPWELQGDEAELRDFGRRRMAAYPRRPSDAEDWPATAAEALRASVGPFELDDVLLIPRTPRPTGFGELAWVVTPTAAVAVGEDAVAYWVDGPGGGTVVRRIGFPAIAALIDRTLLLYGRLEIAGASDSIVVRYNTVSRQFVRRVLLEVRRSFWPAIETEAAGPDPRSLHLKWTNVLYSADLQPHGPEPRVVAASEVTPQIAKRSKPSPHQGVAALTPTELQLAIEPTGDGGIGAYGVDLVVAPRSRVLELGAGRAALRMRVRTAGGEVAISVPAEPGLAAAAVGAIGPLVHGEPVGQGTLAAAPLRSV